jgi:4-amino-4-deoxy-L-arabinose transferase-like glycosyltransferase
LTAAAPSTAGRTSSGPNAPAARDERRRDLALLALACALVFLPGLGRRDLWNPDEPRYAEVAREMVASGEYLVPHFNGRLYTQKPPLMFWAMAASGAVLRGLDETAARLPSALAAIGGTLLVYALGRRLFVADGRRAAWIAATVFATCSKVLWQARFGQIDMLLTFLVLAGVYWWVRGHLEHRPSFSYLFFAFAGLATIAKGPVGLLPPLLSILAFLALTRDREGFRELRLGRGLVLWTAVVALWLGPALLAGGDVYMRDILLRQNVTRYVNPWGHYQPPWYFLKVLPVDFLPWSLFLPAAILAGRALDRERRRRLLFLGCWVIVTVLFFSVSPGKRTVYILTCYPALALLVGGGLATWSGAAEERSAAASETKAAKRSVGWLAWPAGILAALLWVVAIAAPFAERFAEVPAFGAPYLRALAIGVGVLAAAATASFAFALRGRVTAMVGALALGLATTTLALFVSLLPRLDPQLSLRALAATLAHDRPAPATLASYHEMEGGLLFYGSGFAREVADQDQLRALLAAERGVWLVVDPDDKGGLDWPPAPPLRLVAQQNESKGSVKVFASP